MSTNRDLARVTLSPLLAACVVALIVGLPPDDPNPPQQPPVVAGR